MQSFRQYKSRCKTYWGVILNIDMGFYQAFVFVLALWLVFEPGLSQQDGDDEVQVVTTKKQLKKLIKKEITDAFESFTVDCAAVARIEEKLDAIQGDLRTDTPTDSPVVRQAVARIENNLETVKGKLDSLEKRMDLLDDLGSAPHHAASSCAAILENNRCSPSGYYWVTNGTGHPHSMYCDMTRSCGGVTGGWMRVAYLNMDNSSHRCPSGLRQRTDSGVRSCAAYSTYSATCSSVLYRSHGIQYSQVCGKIIAYQANTLDGFYAASPARESRLDYNYVDGVSLTHGNTPRKHIWTFAAGSCPGRAAPPSFLNDHYFHDGVRWRTIDLHNPLWDGINCGTNTCCRSNNPPWFHRQLPQPTTDGIEMRVCRDQDRRDEDVAIKIIEIYIQ